MIGAQKLRKQFIILFNMGHCRRACEPYQTRLNYCLEDQSSMDQNDQILFLPVFFFTFFHKSKTVFVLKSTLLLKKSLNLPDLLSTRPNTYILRRRWHVLPYKLKSNFYCFSHKVFKAHIFLLTTSFAERSYRQLLCS